VLIVQNSSMIARAQDHKFSCWSIASQTVTQMHACTQSHKWYCTNQQRGAVGLVAIRFSGAADGCHLSADLLHDGGGAKGGAVIVGARLRCLGSHQHQSTARSALQADEGLLRRECLGDPWERCRECHLAQHATHPWPNKFLMRA
jgi:hypothetical protein